MIKIHKTSEFEKMRAAGSLTAKVLNALDSFIDTGVTTNEINDFCHEIIIAHGGKSAPLNYKGFPKSVCTSINDVVCHGIPCEYKLKDGDIVNVDITSIVDGYYGDASKMYMIGESFKDKNNRLLEKKLIKTTYECMMLGIKKAKAGNKLLDIGIAIQGHAEKNGFSCCKGFLWTWNRKELSILNQVCCIIILQ